MASMAKKYTNDLHKHFKTYYANWLPGDPVLLGDYGELKGKLFDRKGNITKDFGIEFDVFKDPTADDYAYTSANAVDLKFHVKGTIPQISTNAAIEIGFKSENAIFFQATKCTFDSIDSQPLVLNKVKEAFKENKLRGYAVVTEVANAASCNIVISGSSGGGMVLEAKSELVEMIDLADAALELKAVNENNIGLKVVSSKGLTPLIGLEKI
ncbi:MAG: hypothetical protein COA57_08735 [Flavobacteriales bacterium]|nr:MAG: hypothetical protein COA57_08735 [Flavobacteriales bacterium]